MRFDWLFKGTPEGVIIQCQSRGAMGGKRVVSPDSWPGDNELAGTEFLRYLVRADKAKWLNDGALLSHQLVSTLAEDRAREIGLPPAMRHALQVKANGRIDQPKFSIEARWLRHGVSPVAIDRQGALAKDGDQHYRLPRSLYSLAEAVGAFQSADTRSREDRIEHWAPVQDALAEAIGEKVQPDGYLEDLRIFHAAAFSLSVDLTKDGAAFKPVLFGQSAIPLPADDLFDSDPMADPAAVEHMEAGEGENAGIDTLLDEGNALLPGHLQKVFVEERWGRDLKCRQAYPLVRNTYVVIDEPLRQALDVVREKQGASPQQRLSFVKNPRAAIAEALDHKHDAGKIAALFVETEQYADRVSGIGLWKPRVLPWLSRPTTGWLPEKIGFQIGETHVSVDPEKLDGLQHACKTAIERGELTFSFDDVIDIPATQDTLDAIDALRPTAERILATNSPNGGITPKGEGDGGGQSDRTVLEQNENFDELLYTLGLKPRSTPGPLDPPSQLIDSAKLFPHQREGFDWMVKSWTSGRPGVLLADDMGLGKTIQTLAFAAWLHQQLDQTQSGNRNPFLIVAPTALLKNWKQEHDNHLLSGGLAPLVELYGSGLNAFRKERHTKRDVDVGEGMLDREALGRTSCVLTTYETLANYHLSLAAIHFPLVVFDEIQKLKTPTTINTHAAKTINADFAVGLTGTPVENSLSELWSIMDRLQPGLLEDLKSFSKTYSADDRTSLTELHNKLTNPPAGPAIMLRRMKDTTDIGKSLPKRFYVSIPKEMPPSQAAAYDGCLSSARQAKKHGGSRGDMLRILHRMRSISLHSEHPMSVLGQPVNYDTYVKNSARLSGAIEAIDAIAERKEKALVFVEFHDMQDLFADIVRHRYQLDHLPMIINGQTPSARRQEFVTRFQHQDADMFDLMIIAPRAGGIGLTITAANHVVHLSRWWNPAVEDQCNDRAYRIGQDKEVTVYCPIARHPVFGDASFDVKLNDLLERKRALSRDLLVPAESESDYREMFEETVIG